MAGGIAVNDGARVDAVPRVLAEVGGVSPGLRSTAEGIDRIGITPAKSSLMIQNSLHVEPIDPLQLACVTGGQVGAQASATLTAQGWELRDIFRDWANHTKDWVVAGMRAVNRGVTNRFAKSLEDSQARECKRDVAHHLAAHGVTNPPEALLKLCS